jgi:hypothetical protein
MVRLMTVSPLTSAVGVDEPSGVSVDSDLETPAAADAESTAARPRAIIWGQDVKKTNTYDVLRRTDAVRAGYRGGR